MASTLALTAPIGQPHTLWLVRHAKPLVAAGICYGRTDLLADREATAQCARSLADALPANTLVISSPLQRCEQLAKQLCQLRNDLAYTTDARLQEMDFGRWEGIPWQSIPPSELQAWTDAFASHAAGQDGENVTRFMQRVASAFDELHGRLDGLKSAPIGSALNPSNPSNPGNLKNSPQNVLWITHAGVIRAVSLLAQGLRHIEHAKQWPIDAPDYGQWHKLDLKK